MSRATTTGRALYRSDLSADEQRAAFTGGEVPVAVYGLGKMGLPLAAVYADVTGVVTGVDVDAEVVEQVSRGACPVAEPGLPGLVAETVAADALTATTDAVSAATSARVHVVVVPTLVDDDEPDLTAVVAALETIAAGLERDDVILVESTLPPRTCRDRLLPLLESESDLGRGEFGLAFCPERTKSGQALADIRGTHPKVVGGVDEESTRVATLVYEQLTDNDVIPVADATTAEAVKVFEGVYRDVNIALANELGTHASALDIDVTEAIEAANTLPVCDIHTPGVGVGGHCIPYYPHFLIRAFDADSRLMETAREVNERMPTYTAEEVLAGIRAEGVVADGARVLVLGLTYRPGVDEIQETPALPLVERLATAGAEVVAADPVTEEVAPFEAAGASVLDLDVATARSYDAVALVTEQPTFEDLSLPSLGPDDANRRLVVVDGRQALRDLRDHDDVHYRGIGINA